MDNPKAILHEKDPIGSQLLCHKKIHLTSPHIKFYGLPSYEARVRFGTRVRVRVRVRDSAIFEKIGCGCSGTRRLKNDQNIDIYIF